MTDIRKKITQDTYLANVLLLSLLVMAISLQALIVVAWVFSFIPIKISPLIATLSLRHQALIVLKRDISFYHFFIAAACFLQAAGVFLLKQQLERRTFIRSLAYFTLAEYGWTFLIVFGVFKMFVYGFAPWTKVIFYLGLIASILSKIFWKELREFVRWGKGYWQEHKSDIKTQRFYDGAFVLLIFLIINIPDTQGLLSKMFITDHFDHFDTSIMASAWGHLKGNVIDIDQQTFYFPGLPIVMGSLAQLLGGFSYSSMVILLGLGMIVYFIGVYALARYWLKSIPLSIAMVILLIKWQIFQPGVATIIFDYPSATIWRNPLDLILLFLLLSHLRHPDRRLLIAAAIVCGLSCFYMIDTGTYLSIAFAFYIVFSLVMDLQEGLWKNVRPKVLNAAGILLIIPGVTLGCLWLSQGQYLFTKTFWENLFETTTFFLLGHDALHMYKSLIEGKYLDSWEGFFIPWVYTFVLIVTSTLLFLRKVSKEYLFVATVSVYGLGLYHYYACRSADTSFYVVALPYVFILGFILNWVITHQPSWRKGLLAAAMAITFFSLLTNHYFLDYPNIFNFSKNPMTHPIISIEPDDGIGFFNHNDLKWPEQFKLATNSLGETDEMLKTEKDFGSDAQLKDFYHREFDFSQDAALIDRLTSQDERVPLISSFETKFLMQADRRAFFYYSPFVDTRPMHMRMFVMTALWSTGRVNKTLQLLQEKSPPYIFMEKILLAQSVPASYEYLYPDLLIMLNYIHRYYVPYEQGHYLVAMKRRV